MVLDIKNPLSNDTLEFLKSASVRSYMTVDELKDFYSKEGLTVEFIEDKESDGQAFVVSSPGFTLIAFRGTESKIDFITDLNCFRVKTSLGKIHRGFFQAFQRLWPILKVKIDLNKPLIITGHSLGGALAQLCGVWSCDELKKKPDFFITYGQPRVGGRELAKNTSNLLARSFFRITHKLDVVPRVPPYWFFTYVHVPSTGYKRNKLGNGQPHSFLDRHCWNIGFLVVSSAFGYLAYQIFLSHSIAGY